jgi:hypothetical protein
MWKHLHVNYPLFVSDFNATWVSWRDFRKRNLKYEVSSQFVSWAAESFHADRWTDVRTYITKLIVAYRCFANAPKNSSFCSHSAFMCFVWLLEETELISLYSINWLVFITETESVYYAVRAGSLKKKFPFVLKRLQYVIHTHTHTPTYIQ